MIEVWIDAHPRLVGLFLFGLGVILTAYGDRDTGPRYEPDGLVMFFALALLACGFLGMVGIIT